MKRFEVSSGTVRLDDGHTAKGYYRQAFDDAFARYLPDQNVTTSQPAETQAFQADSKTSQGNGCDVSESPGMPSISASCDGVTFSEPLFWANDVAEFDEERAAIREFEGGYSRADAERLAREEAEPPRG
jgi:hypothetical protein